MGVVAAVHARQGRNDEIGRLVACGMAIAISSWLVKL
jgi:hypothetical protein